MNEQTPAMEIAARVRRRSQFVLYLILFLLVMSAATWFVLPQMSKLSPELTPKNPVPGHHFDARTTVHVVASWFKAFWFVCVLGAIGLAVLAKHGLLDPLLPLLNLALLVAGVGVVGLCLFSYYAMLGSVDLKALK